MQFLYKSYFFILTSFIFHFSAVAQTETLADFFEKDSIQAEKTAEGLYYQITKTGNGAKPKLRDYIMLHFTGKLLNGEVFETSLDGDPFVFQLGYGQVIRGWDLGLQHFPVGSEGVLYIPAALGYGKNGAGQLIPPDAPLTFDIQVLKILSPAEYDQYMTELEEKERIAYENQVKEQFVKDKKLIQDYALSNKLKTKRASKGASYIVTKTGKGDTPQKDDFLEIEYEGYLTDGTLFDSTKGKGLYKFAFGRNKVIEGLEDGLQYFNKGSEGWILIPSKLAYGPRPIYEKDVSIPSNSVLIFKVKVAAIHKGDKL